MGVEIKPGDVVAFATRRGSSKDLRVAVVEEADPAVRVRSVKWDYMAGRWRHAWAKSSFPNVSEMIVLPHLTVADVEKRFDIAQSDAGAPTQG